jgi:hypothetical protein
MHPVRLVVLIGGLAVGVQGPLAEENPQAFDTVVTDQIMPAMAGIGLGNNRPSASG